MQNGDPLVENPQLLGFRHIEHPIRDTPKFLLDQQPILEQRQFHVDEWDQANQQKMLRLEESHSDPAELYEILKKMRDLERKIMENKSLVDKPDSSKNLNDAIVFQGTCQDMCPIFERARRNVEFTVYSYEKNSPNDKKAARSKAIKVFARPAAAAAPPLPSDVRPPHILVKTLDYIVDNLLTTLPQSEKFLWDRMRSIRQDFTYQNYAGPEAVDCNERIVRIHLLTIHIMIASNSEFSLQQELEQLHKALITLSEIYDDVRANGGKCPNEAEFRAYSLLSKIRDPEYDKTIERLPQDIFQNQYVQIALILRKIVSNSSFNERGYIRTENSLNFYLQFFRLLASGKIPIFLSIFAQLYIDEVRFYAFKALSLSINKKHKPIPIDYLVQLMAFNNKNELLDFCKYYSIEVTPQGVDLKTLNLHSHKLSDKKPMKQNYLKSINDRLKGNEYKNLINFVSQQQHTNNFTRKASIKLDQVPETPIPKLRSTTIPKSEEPKLENKKFGAFSTIHPDPAPVIKHVKPTTPEIIPKIWNKPKEVKVKVEEPKVVRQDDTFAKKSRRVDKINTLANELYYAFLHEKVYIIYLESKAEIFRKRALKKHAFKHWNYNYKKEKNAKLQKIKEKKELDKVEKQLGVPLERKIYTTPVDNRHAVSASPNSTFFSPVVNEINRFQYKIDVSSKVWAPLDLENVYFRKLETSMEKQNIEIIIFAKNCISIPNKWLTYKFKVAEDKRLVQLTNPRNNARATIKLINDEYDPNNFKNTQLLVFNTGVTDDNIFDLELKLQQDGEDLVKLVTGISLNTNICFSIVLVFWESAETRLSSDEISKLLRLGPISQNFSSVIDDIVVVQLTGDKPHKYLEAGLTQVAQHCKGKLTDRGKYNMALQQGRRSGKTRSISLQTTQNIDKKMKKKIMTEKENRAKEQNALNTYSYLQSHIEASPRARKRKLPVLLSNAKSNATYRTPLPRVPSIHSADGSRTVSSHLAMKFRKTHAGQRISSGQGLLSLGTPTQSTNIPRISSTGSNTTPHITTIGPQAPVHISQSTKTTDTSSRLACSVSLARSITDPSIFRTPAQAYTHDTPSRPAAVPETLLELKDLIASVKKKIKNK